MSDYGLYLNSHSIPLMQDAEHAQLDDMAYAWDSKRTPKQLPLSVSIKADSITDLKSKIDSIRSALNERTDKELALDLYDDRYWLARLRSFTGNIISPTLFQGKVDFICYDPNAYDNTETSSDYSIDADPKSVYEETGGTALIKPVYTLVAGEDLAGATIKVKNDNSSEEFIWAGNMSITDIFVIDVTRMYVTLEGASAMDGITQQQFPLLVPNTFNEIIVTGFGSLGTLNITYRSRYI